MKSARYILGAIFLFSTVQAFSETIKIPLSELDQQDLAQHMSKIELPFRSEETVNANSPDWYTLNKYTFLTGSDAFFINCSEEFHAGSVIGIHRQCAVGFNYEKSLPGSVEVHNGFMSAFAIAEIKDQSLASVLYKTIGNGVSPSVFFSTSEQLPFTHPTTGQKFTAFRLRIDCRRDASYKNFSCIISVVK